MLSCTKSVAGFARKLQVSSAALNEHRPYNWASNNSMLDVGTRPIFNEDHDMFRESVRRFFKVFGYIKNYIKCFIISGFELKI